MDAKKSDPLSQQSEDEFAPDYVEMMMQSGNDFLKRIVKCRHH